MFADQLKKNHKLAFITFTFFESILLILFISISFRYRSSGEIIRYILVGLIIIGFLLFVFLINHKNKQICRMFFKIESMDYKVPYPTSFKKKNRQLLIDGKRAYTIHNHIIPAKFVEFVEGNRAYLIKELSKIHETNHYKVLYVHKRTYALIVDVDHKKSIIHMNCLSEIN